MAVATLPVGGVTGPVGIDGGYDGGQAGGQAGGYAGGTGVGAYEPILNNGTGLSTTTTPQFNLNDIKVINGQCVIAKAGITGVNDENSPCRKLYGAPLGSTSSGTGTSATLLNNAPVN